MRAAYSVSERNMPLLCKAAVSEQENSVLAFETLGYAQQGECGPRSGDRRGSGTIRKRLSGRGLGSPQALEMFFPPTYFTSSLSSACWGACLHRQEATE